MRILGFDPGYAITGWGVVSADHPRIVPIDYGCIRTKAGLPMSVRLSEIYRDVVEVIARTAPDRAVVEKLYFSQNKTTAGSVYEARGVILAALGSASIPVLELSPVQIKQAVTGSGRATKSDVITMVQKLLGITEKISPDDTADALGCAIGGLFAAESGSMLDALGGKI